MTIRLNIIKKLLIFYENFKNARMINNTPLIQDRSICTFFAIKFPIADPEIIASIPNKKDNEITCNKLISANAAPNPAASPSRERAIASETASVEDR